MEFGLSQEQTLLTDSIARFLASEAPLDRVRRFARDQDDQDERLQPWEVHARCVR